jgi:uncharacterized protein (DUF697 family)
MENTDIKVEIEQTENKTQESEIVDSKENGAQTIVNKYLWWAAGAGLIPIPYLDLGSVIGVQIKMLSDLSKYYGVEFSQNAGKSIIAALIGGLSTEGLSKNFVISSLKTIPFIGILFNLSYPAFSVGVTYAVGKVFIQHFESGGTLLDFKPEKMKEYFAEMYKKGKKLGSSLKPQKA